MKLGITKDTRGAQEGMSIMHNGRAVLHHSSQGFISHLVTCPTARRVERDFEQACLGVGFRLTSSHHMPTTPSRINFVVECIQCMSKQCMDKSFGHANNG